MCLSWPHVFDESLDCLLSNCGRKRIKLRSLSGETMSSYGAKGDAKQASRVIVFTRCPEAGKTKTRMIPALGPEGAAALQVALTRHTLNAAKQYCEEHSCELEVRFAGGNAMMMGDVFGHDIQYRPQHGSDLGARLTDACSKAFQEGAGRVVVIGSDCPDIDATVLDDALRSMPKCDVVIGPAIDGGYYLIGLCGSQPQLFADIDWGGDRVLQQTLDKAERSHLHIHRLKPLSDVDHPEDLIVCQRYPESFSELLAERGPLDSRY